MWIEAPASTRAVSLKEYNSKGEVIAVHSALFNHNGRAEVTKKSGQYLLKAIPALKSVKDVNDEETNDGD